MIAMDTPCWDTHCRLPPPRSLCRLHPDTLGLKSVLSNTNLALTIFVPNDAVSGWGHAATTCYRMWLNMVHERSACPRPHLPDPGRAHLEGFIIDHA
jgi:hypothetical protein